MTIVPGARDESVAGAPSSGGLETIMLLASAQSAAASAADATLSRIGISIDDLRLLTAIGRTDPDRSELARMMHATPSQTIRKVRPLEKLGWIQRTADAHFQLTASGRAILDEAALLADDSTERWLLDRLLLQQVDQLRTALRSLAETS